MSFATALATLFGGYQQGREQKQIYQNNLAQQNEDIALRHQQADLERQKFEAEKEATTRARGIDPATGRPFIIPPTLSQVRPHNQGHGGQPTLQELYSHNASLAAWYAQQGATDVAAQYGANAADLQRQIQAAESAQTRTLLDFFNQSQMNDRSKNASDNATERQNIRDGVELGLAQMRISAGQQGRQQSEVFRQADTAARAAQSHAAAVDTWVSGELGKMNAANSIATRDHKPPTNPNMDYVTKSLNAGVGAVRKDPSKAQAILTKIMAVPNISEAQRSLLYQAISRAAMAAGEQQNAAKLQKAALSTGGSDAGGNPPPSPWP